MRKYEYKFVDIQRKAGVNAKSGDTFEECKQVIKTETEQGWRLKQVVTPFDESKGIFAPTLGYHIIFEKEI